MFPVILTIVIICFVLFFSGMAIWTAFLDFDLVSDDYYQRGIEYQKQIDRISTVAEKDLRIIWKQAAHGAVILMFPEIADNSDIRGKLMFFRPSDAKQDKIVKINPDIDGQQEVSIRNLSKGYWILKIFWSLDGQELYQEDDLLIQ